MNATASARTSSNKNHLCAVSSFIAMPRPALRSRAGNHLAERVACLK
jgi:hypothetical protein